MTPGDREAIRKHGLWARGEKGGEEADLTDAVLTDAVLRGAVLSGAVLRRAVLTGADLRRAVLTGADLTNAVLMGAVLTGADLSGADLSGAVLSGAVLRGAVLRGADLRGAVLRGADLTGADLRRSGLLVLHVEQYDVYVQKQVTRIGCRCHTNKQWLSFEEVNVACFADDARDVFVKYGSLIKEAILLMMEEE